MSRITISSDGGAILIRQGATVIVLAPEQAQSVAATIVLESERVADRQHKEPLIRGCAIQKTGHHDAGAIARCSYCGRYSDDPKALQYDPRSESPNDLRCDCGKTHGWCGSFKRPTETSLWSGAEKERKAVKANDSECRSFNALAGSRHSKRTIESDGNDETETMSDARQRLREAGLDGTDSTGG